MFTPIVYRKLLLARLFTLRFIGNGKRTMHDYLEELLEPGVDYDDEVADIDEFIDECADL